MERNKKRGAGNRRGPQAQGRDLKTLIANWKHIRLRQNPSQPIGNNELELEKCRHKTNDEIWKISSLPLKQVTKFLTLVSSRKSCKYKAMVSITDLHGDARARLAITYLSLMVHVVKVLSDAGVGALALHV